MKTLIIYATTYGFTEECIKDLEKNIKSDVNMINIMKDQSVDLNTYDTILIGGSIYMGHIQSQLKTFCEQNLSQLKAKKIGLFLCCGFADNFDQQLQSNFPVELIEIAFAKQCFGGELRIDKMNFAHKLITKMMKKMTAKDNKPEPIKLSENIINFANAINGIRGL